MIDTPANLGSIILYNILTRKGSKNKFAKVLANDTLLVYTVHP